MKWALRRLRRLRARLAPALCPIGWHVPYGAWLFVSPTPPRYEFQVVCLYCLRRFR